MERASDYYGHAKTCEDYTMLFEETLMLDRFAIYRDVGIANSPVAGAPCADYIVEWGARNRVTDPQVRARAVWVIGDALPEARSAVEQFLTGENSPTANAAGMDCCTNRHLDSMLPRRSSPGKVEPVKVMRPWL